MTDISANLYRVAFDESTKTYVIYHRDAIVHRENTANAAHLWINSQLASQAKAGK